MNMKSFLAQDRLGCCTLQNLHKYQPAVAMSPQHFSSATPQMLHSLAPQGALTATLHHQSTAPTFCDFHSSHCTLPQHLLLSLQHDQCNPEQLRATHSMHVAHTTNQTNTTIKQTMHLKLPENMTMYIGRNPLCKCTV